MRKLLTLLLALPLAWGHAAAQENAKYTILLTGASFASPQNGWFEIGCRQLDARAINRAIGGESIADTANRDGRGHALERRGAGRDGCAGHHAGPQPRCLGHGRSEREVHRLHDAVRPEQLRRAFDYVIKRYQSECYALKDDPKSKYYGTKSGKPAVIVLCTDWHDARTTYNAAIRRLAARWGLPLVEFDRNIGFSKDTPNPATGTQQSLLHAQDTQTIEGVAYGWHPQRGQDKYIQQRMAAIFTDTMRRILPAK